jgi:hypothetical protein
LSAAKFVEEIHAASGADEDDGDGFGGGHARFILAADEFLAACVSAVREFGWVSSKGEGEPTKERALFLCSPPPHDSRALAEWRRGQPTELDRARAKMIIEWCASSTQTSDYALNFKVAVQRSINPARTAGLVASDVIAYAREIEHAEKAKSERAARPESTYFGEIGKRYDLTGKIFFVRHIEGEYGTTTLLGFVDEEGRMFKWFASGGRDFEVGEKVALKGTVKKHEDYKGEKGTVLTWCKVQALKESP